MTDDEFGVRLQPLHTDQVRTIRGLCGAISEHTAGLEKRINDGK